MNGALIRVRDVMTPSIRMIGRMDTVAQAIEAMRDAGVSSLVVERRDPADEYGLVTVAGIARDVIARERPPERINVYEVMTKPVLTVPTDMQTKYAVRLLVTFDLSRALVVDHSRVPVGIVTLRDMVLREAGSTAQQLR
ncbi:MAG: CBS domain-containing protein [Rhodospirillales bacterium]|nr:CBS domain-containing protein [Rhodospirillales bacterium]